ncbi:MAG: hypothetical protein ACLQIB_30275 [Isosphaeraceae bacterium]
MPVGKPWAPHWLVDALAVDFFGHVVCVSLPPETDADAVRVERLSGLERLYVGNSPLSDAGMADLGGLTNLSDFESVG